MKLNFKLTLSLLIGLIVVLSVAQIIQHKNMSGIISELSVSNMQLLKEREVENALNIFNSVDRAIAGSLERGEMEKFTKLIKAQKKVKGLLEFSLFDKNGNVTHSSDSSFIGNKLTGDLKKKLFSDNKIIIKHTVDSIDIYKPQPITGDCVRCHMSWKEGGTGGVTYFRFSNKALKTAGLNSQTVMAKMQTTSLKSSFFSLFLIIVLCVILMTYFVRKFVGIPLGQFVGFLRLFEKDEGDLTRRIPVKTEDEIGELSGLFNAFIGKLNTVILKVQNVVKLVQGKVQSQTESVSEATSAINGIASMTGHNSENANNANKLMQTISEEFFMASEAMKLVIESIEELAEKSDQTVKVIQNIDGIAFQTNLLSLNAAVEAARAGDAGVGFAVVAGEVGNLAKKSAKAAKNTSELIEATIQKTDSSKEQVEKTKAAFEKVEARLKKTSILMSDIASSSTEQFQSIEDVNNLLKNIDHASKENTIQFEQLIKIVSMFKTDNND
ncbi:MAG: HAMP domain-containing protein [Desulfosarcina sp.]|nr:HAMP domain-containing protein [Desulfobacterales bacterium]